MVISGLSGYVAELYVVKYCTTIIPN